MKFLIKPPILGFYLNPKLMIKVLLQMGDNGEMCITVDSISFNQLDLTIIKLLCNLSQFTRTEVSV
jgi:hypothetical protein